MNRTYEAMNLNNCDLNIEKLYFTDRYLSLNPINPLTGKVYTEEEKIRLPRVMLTAPDHALIAVSVYEPAGILWFDENGTKAIVTHTDALRAERNFLKDADGNVVVAAISRLTDVELSEANLTALHSSMDVLDGGIVRSVKTEKMDETDINSYVAVNDIRMKNGIVELDVRSRLLPDCWKDARGFIGLVFRIDDRDMEHEGFYIRPTNGKGCNDPVRHSHGCQYYAYPGYTWFYYREFGITDYEAPVDTIALDEWEHIKAEIIDEHARFWVNDELVLEVKKMQHIPSSGRIAMRTENGSECFFRNLRVEVFD